MTQTLGVILLLGAPAMPVLLCIPAIRRRAGGFLLVALLPAAVLVFWPTALAAELPWLLLGEGEFAVRHSTRALLAQTLVIWTAALWLLRRGREAGTGGERLVTWCLLLLGGQIGAILADDAVSFFAFSSLVGYAFLGLLFGGEEPILERAGRRYVVQLVVADLILFEALVIAAFDASGERLRFPLGAGFEFAGNGIWPYLATLAFLLRAGCWPFHAGSALACRTSRSWVILLLWGGPVTAGLLGVLNWLPAGPFPLAPLGWMLVALASGGLVFAIASVSGQAQAGSVGRFALFAVSGLLLLGVGGGLIDAAIRDGLEDLLPYLVSGFGLLLTVLTLGRLRRGPVSGRLAASASRRVREPGWYERAVERAGGIVRRVGVDILPGFRQRLLALIVRHAGVSIWLARIDALEGRLGRWAVALVLFLGIAILIIALGLGAVPD